ncbi:hypothetical protein BDR03DRAFT_973965 [Suillus americanus]|nr:hypothetical protein BDR03DRAFT_973965 [Suillus americanus]
MYHCAFPGSVAKTNPPTGEWALGDAFYHDISFITPSVNNLGCHLSELSGFNSLTYRSFINIIYLRSR